MAARVVFDDPEAVLRDLRDGQPYREVAQREGCSLPTLYRFAWRHGLRKPLNVEALVSDVRGRRGTYAQIGARHGRSKGTVARYARLHGVNYRHV